MAITSATSVAELRLTAEEPGEISIVAIGPLTNLAVAAIKDPTFPARVKQLVIMGGSNNGRGNITPAAEFNFYVDPHAARIVFEAGFDITLVPWAPLTLQDAVFSCTTLRGSPGATLFWSGNAPGGDFNRFNDLFPLGHKYLGFIDAVRRQNIEAPNVLLTMKPHAKVDILCWYWHFMANQPGGRSKATPQTCRRSR